MERSTQMVAPRSRLATSVTRIAPLDGLRAVAIVLVLFAHAADTSFTAAMGSLGVNVFFVLSGFLITSLLLREQDRTGTINLRAFYGRRVRRIFPAYYVFLLIIAITTFAGFIQVDWRALIYDALYLRNYSFNVPPDWWTGHSWSLCIEEQFYFIWPAVLIVGGKRFGWLFAVLCIVGAPFLRIFVYAALPAYRDFIDVMLPTHIDTIMFGCGLAILMIERGSLLERMKERTVAIITAMFTLGVIAGLFLTARYHGLYALTVGYTIMGFAGAFLLLYVVQFPTTATARALSWAPVAWFGRISYSLYLWQQPFLTPHLNQSLSGRFPVNLLAAIAIATASYYFIERRFFVAKPLSAQSVGVTTGVV